MRWECSWCTYRGEGTPPERCEDPECGGRIKVRLVGLDDCKLALVMHNALKERAENVASLLDYGCDRISFADTNFDDPNSTFSVFWEETWNYGGYDSHDKDIPARYLWMTDEDIQAELDAKKAAADAEARQLAIKQAEKAAEWARFTARTAAATAEKALAQAEANLAALRGA